MCQSLERPSEILDCLVKDLCLDGLPASDSLILFLTNWVELYMFHYYPQTQKPEIGRKNSRKRGPDKPAIPPGTRIRVPTIPERYVVYDQGLWSLQ